MVYAFERQNFRADLAAKTHLPKRCGRDPWKTSVARIAELGDGWLPMERDPAKLKPHIDRLQAAFKARGRDPKTLTVRTGLRPMFRADRTVDLDATFAQMPAVAAAGINILDFNVSALCKQLTALQPLLTPLPYLHNNH